jgi:hypothetical protein
MLSRQIIKNPDGTKTFIYEVSPLTKEWAFKGVESSIRALAGAAIKDSDKVIIKYKE